MSLGLAIYMLLCNAILSGCHDGCTAVVETKLELGMIEIEEADAEFTNCVFTYCPPAARGCMASFPGINPFSNEE